MIKLSIDTTDRKISRIGIIQDKKQDFVEKESKKNSQVVLPLILQILKKNKLSFKDLTEIEVNPGPGSFTGIRVGLSIANALASVLRIPINGKAQGQASAKYK